jgi:hypothetical protein
VMLLGRDCFTHVGVTPAVFRQPLPDGRGSEAVQTGEKRGTLLGLFKCHRRIRSCCRNGFPVPRQMRTSTTCIIFPLTGGMVSDNLP